MREESEVPERRWDHPLVGALASLVLVMVLAAIGLFLLVEGDSTGRRQIVPEVLRLPGLVLMMFSGLAGAGLVTATRASATRRGWPRAARTALWTSIVLAVLNLALVGLVFALRFRQLTANQV